MMEKAYNHYREHSEERRFDVQLSDFAKGHTTFNWDDASFAPGTVISLSTHVSRAFLKPEIQERWPEIHHEATLFFDRVRTQEHLATFDGPSGPTISLYRVGPDGLHHPKETP